MDDFKHNIIELLGNNTYLLLIMFTLVLFKGFLESAVQGLLFWSSKDFSVDDIVLVNGDRARITKIGFSNTYFHILERDTKLVVPNCKIKGLRLEKILQK